MQAISTMNRSSGYSTLAASRAQASCARPTVLLIARRPPSSAAAPRRSPAATRAGKGTGNKTVDGALSAGKGLVDAASELVPESVPRPVAKGGVAVVGVVVAFWLMQKVLSTLLTIALLGGAAFLYFRSSSSSDSSGGGGSGSGGSSGGARDDDSDPLAEARRIMDKYR